MISEGLGLTKSVLIRYGVPVEAFDIVAEDITAALKGMAANDATVPSMQPGPAVSAALVPPVPHDALPRAAGAFVGAGAGGQHRRGSKRPWSMGSFSVPRRRHWVR